MKLNRILSLTLLLPLFVLGCSGTGIVSTNNNNNNPDLPEGTGFATTPESFALGQVFLDLFSLGSDFPPDIQIPDIPGMESTAFIVTFFPPAVLALDLNKDPLGSSGTFKTFDASSIPEAAFPNNVLLLSPTQGFLLGSTGVSYFNPSTGAEIETLALDDPITPGQTLPLSMACNYDGSGPDETEIDGPFVPNFPADMAFANGRLFITMSNSCFDDSFESAYVQGILLVFDLNDSSPFLTPASTPFLILPGYNATGLTVWGDQLIATSTGDTTLSSGVAAPETDSFLTLIDPAQIKITNTLNLGLVAANFQPLAITGDQTRGFIGSSAFSEVYEIDLPTFSVVRGATDPILIFGEADDFISDQEMAFGDQVLMVSSFNHSAVRAIDLNGTGAQVLPEILDFAFPENPGVTGGGPMALRPGEPNEDFTGPDLWVLTSSPGSVSSALTY